MFALAKPDGYRVELPQYVHEAISVPHTIPHPRGSLRRTKEPERIRPTSRSSALH